MEREVWRWIVPVVTRIAATVQSRPYRFGWDDILLTYLWSVLWTKPICWACDARNWPEDLRPERLPSNATMSRRLRHAMVYRLLRRMVRQLQRGRQRGLVACADGKPLTVARHTQDPDARSGRGAGGMAMGYKIHLILGKNGRIEDFEVRPLNEGESTVAREMIARTALHGYLLADANYDGNPTYKACGQRDLQLVAPRRKKGGLGHRDQDPTRRRAVDMLEGPCPEFGRSLLRLRGEIERAFGQLCSSSYGLYAPPPWVRTLPRVQRWVAARLLFCTIIKRRKVAA